MRLSQFILTNIENILSEFEAFARSIGSADRMDVAGLRDHAREMLSVIVRDLETPQTERERSNKAKGLADALAGSPETPAQEHGSGRAESGFTVEQMVSEYRALRASVVRLWLAAEEEKTALDYEDLVRFSEAIDQALAESTSRFMRDLDRTRERFLGILGHDLRTPLGAITTSARFMLDEEELTPTSRKLLSTIASSGSRMERMVTDLLDFTRSRLGASIPIEPSVIDLNELVKASIEEVKASRPDADVRLQVSGDLIGEWDGARLSQVLSNLLSNALSHGAEKRPITVSARGAPHEVAIEVHNFGRRISSDRISHLFDPLRGAADSRDPTHLGLGLYIAERIVHAHKGTITVESTEEDGTRFTVRMPRRAVERS